MAKKVSTQGKITSTSPAPNGGKVTKQEAVRQALAALGRTAKPLQLQAWIREHLGIEMTTDHVSTAKGIILRKKGKAKSRGKKVAAQAMHVPPLPSVSSPKEPTRKEAGIPLDDILLVKQLVGRFGAGQLHTLIDAFAK
jgi:hypothetical protein